MLRKKQTSLLFMINRPKLAKQVQRGSFHNRATGNMILKPLALSTGF